ncbi:MAG TPA: ComEA family DNA-binding protein [Mycobacterium sp.]|nr:ComEA family DNA-binding protein [Mycobacterium sp.]
MRTELPAERLFRRLGVESEHPDGVDDSAAVQSGRDGDVHHDGGDEVHDNHGSQSDRSLSYEAHVDQDEDDDDSADTRALWPRWIPDGVAGGNDGWLAAVRADPGRAGAIALGVLAVVAVLVTVFTLVRAQPAPVVSAKLPPVQAPATAPSSAVKPGSDVSLVVSVVGLVKSPGVVTLAPGARVGDAVTAAGGVLKGSDSVGLNLARRLADGEQVVVGISAPPNGPAVLGSSVGGAGTPPASGPSPGPGPGPGPRPAATPLDLNAATAEQLDALPGVGPVTAAAIVAWRDKNGRFRSVDQLGDVDGIGPARLEKLRDLVRV